MEKLMETNGKDPIERLREAAMDSYQHNGTADLTALADEIEFQYMKLPVDADGVPIRPGDVMERTCAEVTEPFTAWYMTDQDEWFFDEEHDPHQSSCCRHVKENQSPPYDNLINCLENDYGIKAEWDGLRKVWVTERSKPECTECAEGLARYADSLCDPLKTDLRCMTFERDFWRDEVKRLRGLLSSTLTVSPTDGNRNRITFAGRDIPVSKTEVSMDEGMADKAARIHADMVEQFRKDEGMA